MFETSLEYNAWSFREGGEVLVRNGDGESCLLAIQWPLENTIIARYYRTWNPVCVHLPAGETIQNSMAGPL